VRALLITIVVVVVIVAGLNKWTTNTYAITPGTATPVAPLVKISGVSTNAHPGTILFTDVYLQSLSAWQWLVDHFSSHVQFVPADELVEPGVSLSELDAQGYLEMRDAKQFAEVEAFRTLGWRVTATPVGAIINGIEENSPAARAGLHVGDQVVAVGTTTVATSCQLVRAVHEVAPHTKVTLKVKPVKISSAGTLRWGAVTSKVLTSATVPKGLTLAGCAGASGAGRSYLGVTLEDDVAYALPATVSINTANIGGPSAGLAMTLALVNKLSAGSLTGHHVIAATGTMSLNGVVGDVGGVAEKTVAVQRAGASYFFVPEVEVATARAAASPGLTIVGVRTLKQALGDLQRLGGTSPVALSRP